MCLWQTAALSWTRRLRRDVALRSKNGVLLLTITFNFSLPTCLVNLALFCCISAFFFLFCREINLRATFAHVVLSFRNYAAEKGVLEEEKAPYQNRERELGACMLLCVEKSSTQRA